jgi:hypothetical protein
MKNAQLITFGLLLVTISTKAQEETSKFKFSDVYIQTNLHLKESNPITLTDFTQIHGATPNASVDFQNYDNYNSSYQTLKANLSIGASIMKLSEKRFSPKFSFKLGLEQGVQFHQYYSQTESKRIDTLSSPNSSTVFYHDSLFSEYYNFNYNADNIRLDFSFKLVSDTKKRLSYSFGLGGSFLMSHTSNSSTWHSTYEVESFTSNNNESNNSFQYYSQSYGESSFTFENKKTKTNYGFGVIAPLELDFRISKKDNFFEPFHIYYELQPTFTVSMIPNFRTVTDFWCQHGLGLKYNF